MKITEVSEEVAREHAAGPFLLTALEEALYSLVNRYGESKEDWKSAFLALAKAHGEEITKC